MRKNKILWALVGAGIILAFLLSFAHYFDLCTKECAEGHNWRLFGFQFEIIGLILFTFMTSLYILSNKWPALAAILGLSLVASLGSEIYFIYIQATQMAAFCPICLGIAASLTLSTVSFFLGGFYPMKSVILSIPAAFLGFFAAFLGVAKFDGLQAAQSSIEQSLSFGKQTSPIEVYLFTDWACPACRNLEPQLKTLVPAITSKAKFYFVDHVIHPETLNFIPYNLSFLIHNKDKYLQIRDALTEVSIKTGTPDEKQIEEAASKLGIKYEQLNYADVALGIKYFKELGQKYKIQGTPTLVIINTQTKKGKKLVGNDEINLESVTKAIEALESQTASK